MKVPAHWTAWHNWEFTHDGEVDVESLNPVHLQAEAYRLYQRHKGFWRLETINGYAVVDGKLTFPFDDTPTETEPTQDAWPTADEFASAFDNK